MQRKTSELGGLEITENQRFDPELQGQKVGAKLLPELSVPKINLRAPPEAQIATRPEE